MYVVTTEPVAWFEVEWNTLSEAGEKVVNTMRMKAQLVELPAFEDFIRVFSGAAREGDMSPVDFVSTVARDWDEIVTPDKKPFPFTPENLLTMSYSPGYLIGWQLSYIKAWNGQVKEREKNSEGSPGDGRAGGNRKPPRARQSSSKR